MKPETDQRVRRGESRKANSSRINKEMRDENNQGNKRERDMKVLQTDRKVQDGKQEWYGKDFFPINISFLPLLHTNLKAMEPQKLLCDWSFEWPIHTYLTAL